MSTGKVLEDILAAAVVVLAVRPAGGRVDAQEADARLSEILGRFGEGALIEDATRRVLITNAQFRGTAGLSDSTGELAGEDASSLVGEIPCAGDALDIRLLCPGDGRILKRDHGPNSRREGTQGRPVTLPRHHGAGAGRGERAGEGGTGPCGGGGSPRRRGTRGRSRRRDARRGLQDGWHDGLRAR